MKRSFPIVLVAAFAFLAEKPAPAAVDGDLYDPALAASAVDLMGEVHEKMGDTFSWLVDREPSPGQRLPSPMKSADGKPAPAPAVSAVKAVPVKPAADHSSSVLQRVLAAHEKAIVSVHTAVWKALPKPWELLPKSGGQANAARPAAKGEPTK